MADHVKNQSFSENIPLGISLSIGEVMFTVIIAAFVKFISNDTSVFIILFFRYLFCLPLLLITATVQRGKAALQILEKGKLALRSLFGLASFGFLFAALETIELSKMTALLQTIPIFVTMLAPILIGESVGWRRRSAVLVGFLGVYLIISPSGEGWYNLGTLFGILSPFFGALMLLTLRSLGKTDHPATTAVWYNASGAIVFLIFCLVLDVKWPSSEIVFLVMISIGVMSSFQQFCLANSYKLAPASLLAPLRYLSVPAGVGISIVFFNEHITSAFYFGTGIILAASLFILKRSEKKKRS